MSGARPVLIMAGGTGGHVCPALAVAEQLRTRGVPVAWMGTRSGLEATLVPKAGIPVEWIEVSGLRGKGLGRKLRTPLMLGRALWQASAILRRLRPRVVLGMGGFASGPGGMMARWLGIPLVVHEQNAIAGLTNRGLSRFASRVLEAFPHTFSPARGAVTVGNPVRAAIAALPPPAERFAGREAGLATRHSPLATRYRLTPFIEDMAEAYGWADLVLCRAGALTIAELAAAGVGALLVPFPFAVDDHQTANARFLEQGGAALIRQQADLNAERLAAILREWLGDRARLLGMATAARSLAKIEAAEQVAQACLEQARSWTNHGGNESRGYG
ncbi:MAG: UDP-N-acetylglucosamine:LPS N-acetylglucosamine transferase [Proteobacteria bacterium]|nr:UDP-N-acetylglucosamine:LPS N-acetylglucosamine transferase [Pseudomonadota bacterium]